MPENWKYLVAIPPDVERAMQKLKIDKPEISYLDMIIQSIRLNPIFEKYLQNDRSK